MWKMFSKSDHIKIFIYLILIYLPKEKVLKLEVLPQLLTEQTSSYPHINLKLMLPDFLHFHK